MATISFTIDDTLVPRVTAAFQSMELTPRQAIIRYVRQIVAEYEGNKQGTQARLTAYRQAEQDLAAGVN